MMKRSKRMSQPRAVVWATTWQSMAALPCRCAINSTIWSTKFDRENGAAPHHKIPFSSSTFNSIRVGRYLVLIM
uniref:Putative secreted protein n=1 Tax=Anopheles darlingi TaxID=43151 RepID=A0A2M4DFV4_ANODA